MKKIAVIGLGYVGLANAVLLAMDNHVAAMDISGERMRLVAEGHPPFRDGDIERALAETELNLSLCADAHEACSGADYVIIAVPTDTGAGGGGFDTSKVESAVAEAAAATDGVIVIRSTVPVGFCGRMEREHPGIRLIFVPEFSREGKSLYDCLHPSRVVIGFRAGDGALADAAGELGRLLTARCDETVPVLFMGTAEAEAVKLFANTYLAMRIGFFNELDMFAELNGLNSRLIIDALGLDERIGRTYNNPSFGYGGNCLSKDVRQLQENLSGTPGALIPAVTRSNELRQEFVARRVAERIPRGGTVGIFRLVMKKGSDNFRRSAAGGVMERLKDMGLAIAVYEPLIEEEQCQGAAVIRDIEEFKRISDIILANRLSDELLDVREKVYTRDIFSRD